MTESGNSSQTSRARIIERKDEHSVAEKMGNKEGRKRKCRFFSLEMISHWDGDRLTPYQRSLLILMRK